ncbi:MAG: hypothetical protein ACE37F_25235 [Nannocystaceae bacterium]|nr:hypothetical protein [bacterium]
MLSDAIPEEAIRAIFPDARRVTLADTVSDWQAARKQDVSGTLMYIWDRMVHRKETDTPDKIAPIVNNEYAGIFDFVEQELGAPPVREAFAVEFFNSIDPHVPFVTISLARIHPQELHISDIELADNRHPVLNSVTRTHRGLHLFGEFLERLKRVARESGDTKLSLVAASPQAHDTFSRHGFRVGPTKLDRFGFQAQGWGHGMTCPL